MIKIENLEKSYGYKSSKVNVLKGINLEIDKGELVCIVGPSGSGKSTLMNIIGGIETADSGSLVVDDEDITKFNDKQLTLYRRNKIGFIFQFYNLLGQLNIKENVEATMEVSVKPLDYDEVINKVSMKEYEKKYPSELSGGQQQRASIARAVVKNPKVLLCDEPTGALDYKNSKEVLELLEEVNKKYGSTVVIITHNEAIREMCDRVLRVKDGVIVENTKNDKKISAKEIEW
ncbi:ABC transporter ATP-binding protein [uncultured Clostridium sp.]|uniref:ABC transporter ATP-binding protein n=2 Tax=uncultured Clostridium sp. TaxID=59620 RepID=UPI0025EE11BF|nr:ABC transporter ATP-binding protein [uncultured Clostridium sp.]